MTESCSVCSMLRTYKRAHQESGSNPGRTRASMRSMRSIGRTWFYRGRSYSSLTAENFRSGHREAQYAYANDASNLEQLSPEGSRERADCPRPRGSARSIAVHLVLGGTWSSHVGGGDFHGSIVPSSTIWSAWIRTQFPDEYSSSIQP